MLLCFMLIIPAKLNAAGNVQYNTTGLGLSPSNILGSNFVAGSNVRLVMTNDGLGWRMLIDVPISTNDYARIASVNFFTNWVNSVSNLAQAKQHGTADITNFFLMGITQIVASTGIAIGTNGGKLHITNTVSGGSSSNLPFFVHTNVIKTNISTSFTSMLDGEGTTNITANSFTRGRILHVHLEGEFDGTAGGGTEELAFRTILGSTTVADLPTTRYVTIANGNKIPFAIDMTLICQTVGVSGKLAIGGTLLTLRDDSSGGILFGDMFFFGSSTNLVSYDTTATSGIILAVKLLTGGLGNIVYPQTGYIEWKN